MLRMCCPLLQAHPSPVLGLEQKGAYDRTQSKPTYFNETNDAPVVNCKDVDNLTPQHMECRDAQKPSSSTPREKPPKSTAIDVTTPQACIEKSDFEEYEKQKNYLLSEAKSQKFSLKSTTRRAIEFMLNPGQATILIDLAAAFLFLKFGHSPNGTDVYKTMIDTNFHEKAIVQLFANFVQKATGATALETVPASSSSVLHPSQTHHRQDGRALDSEESAQRTAPGLEDVSENRTVPADLNTLKKAFVNTSDISYTCTSVSRRLVEKENAMLKSKLLCKLCKQREIAVTLLPCGHFVLCEDCSKPCKVCPCCNMVVLADKTTYLC